MRRIDLIENLLGIFAFLAVSAGLYMAFVYAPTERTMGDVQRIFYFHLPLAWIGFLAFFFVFIGGVIYLATRSHLWDILAHSSAEIGVVFSTLVLITGSIWARPVWNTWWTWDPRLTTMLVLWLIYLGYLMARGAVEGAERRARVSAVIGIVGFVDVPIVFMSIRWWRTMHPVVVTRAGVALAPPMLATLLVCLGAFTLLYVYLLLHRVRLGLAEDAVEGMRVRLSDRKFEEE
ncbi:MAG: cytochrome c biogenesis protein CcsA [bacterium]